MTLKEAFRLAASGDWVTAYAMWLVQAQWEAAGVEVGYRHA